MQHYQDVLQDRSGNAIAGAIVTVVYNSTSLPADLYSDYAGTQPLTTVITDADGSYRFYVSSGRYDYAFYKNGKLLKTETDVFIDQSTTLQDLSAPTGAALVGFNPAGTVSAPTVQAAIEELDAEKVGFTTLAATTSAALVGFAPTGTLASTNVQAAIAEINTDLASTSGSGLVGHLLTSGATATTVAKKIKEVVSLLDFGAVGNASTDDTAAIEAAIAWVTAGTTYFSTARELVFPAGYRFRLSRGVVCDFGIHIVGQGAKTENSIVMLSPIVPDAGINAAFTICNAYGGYFKLWVEGVRGQTVDPLTLPNYNLPDPVGCEQAFVLYAVRNATFHITGLSYHGRVLRTLVDYTGTPSPMIKLSVLEIYLNVTGQGVNGITPCGQACYIDGFNSSGVQSENANAFGKFTYLFTQAYYCPVFSGVSDVVIDHMESGSGAAPTLIDTTNLFYKCASVWLGILNLGDESYLRTLMTFNTCHRVYIENYFGVAAAISLKIINSPIDQVGITVNNFVGIGNLTADVVVTDSYDVNIKNLSSSNSYTPLLINGNSSKIQAKVDILYARKEAITIDGTASDIKISGQIDHISQSVLSSFPAVIVNSTGDNIVFNDLSVYGTYGAGSYSLVAGNKVKISGGIYTELPFYKTGSAVATKDVFSVGTGTNQLTQSLAILGATTETKGIEIGQGRTGDGVSYIDFVSDATNTDYGLRILRDAGVNGNSTVTSAGTGNLIFNANGATLSQLFLQTKGVTALAITNGGIVALTNLTTNGLVRTTGGNGSLSVLSIDTGWGAFTGTTNKATVYATSTVTLQQLAERVAALQAVLLTHNIIA